MLDDSLLPAHLRNIEHIAAFEKIWKDRVETIDISQLMMYMVDACSNKALTYLASQFDILSLHSWKLATTDDQRRELIKNAIATRASVGTVAAVKNAISSLGFDPTHLVERAGTDPDTGWAQFKMAFSSSELSILDAALHELLMQLINDAKPARCEYLGLDYTLSLIEESMSETEEVTIAAQANRTEIFNTSGFKYNGEHKYDGSMKYRPGVETLTYVIV